VHHSFSNGIVPLTLDPKPPASARPQPAHHPHDLIIAQIGRPENPIMNRGLMHAE